MGNTKMFLPLFAVLFTIFTANADVIITNIIPNLISGDPLIEHTTSHAITSSFIIGTTAGSDSLTGSNLWALEFFIRDSANVLVSGTEATATLVNANVGVTPGQTFTLQGTANLNLENRICSEFSMFCATLTSQGSFTLTPDTGYDTTVCTAIECQGVVITNVLPAQTSNSPLVQGTNNNDVNLTVTLSSDTSFASIQGTGLWKARGFLNSEVDGTGTRIQDHDVDMLTSADYGLDNNGNSVWPLIQVDFDLTSLSCSEFDYVCIEVQQGTSPSPAFTLGFTPDTANIGCAQIQCTGIVINAGATLTISEGFLEDRSTTVEFDVTYPTSNAGVTGNNLWQVNIYASATADGSGTQQSAQQVILSTANAGMDITTIGDTLSLTGLSATMDFSDLYCASDSINYLCAVLSKSSSASPNFELSAASNDNSEFTVCTTATCSGVLISSVTPTTSDSILQNWASTISINVDLAISSSGGSVSGTGLWDAVVFTSANDTTRTPIVTADVTVSTAAMNEDATAGSTSTLIGITAVFDLNATECVHAPFICVRMVEGSSSSVDFDIDSNSVLEGCFVPTCLGVMITSINIVSDAPVITEYQTTSLDAELALLVLPDADGGSAINGPNLWKIDIYLSGNSDCSGNKNALEAGTLMDTTVTLVAGNMQAFNDVTASLDISALMCSDMEYICADLSPNTGQTFTMTPVTNTASLRTDCRGVLITTVAFEDSLTVIELSMSNENPVVITTLNVTSSGTGASINGSSLWEATIFVNSDDSTFAADPIGTPVVLDEMDLAAGETIQFTNLMADIDMTDKTCLDDAMYICVKLKRQSSSDPVFKLSGVSGSDNDLIGCQPVTCYGVYVTGTTLSITDGIEIIERSTSSQITYNLAITADNTKADVDGTNLWSISSSIYANNNFSTAELISAQTTVDDASVSNGAGTISSAMATFDVSTLLCSQINYFCTVLSKGANADPNFTLTPDPDQTAVQACTSVTCKGVIVDVTTISAGDGATNEWPIVEGKLQNVFLDVTVTKDATSANISGTNLWIFTFYLSEAADGTGTRLHNDDANLDNTQSNQELTTGDPVEFTNVMVVNWDLSAFLCNQAEYICVEIKKNNGVSNPDFTFEGNTVDCMPLQCRGFEINSMVLTVDTGNDIIEWNQNHALTLSVLVNPDTTSADAAGTDLWNATVFYSPMSDGSGVRYAETPATVGGAWRNTDISSMTSETLSSIQATVNLDGACDNLMYVCIEITQSSTADTLFTFNEADSENVACTLSSCTGVVIESSSLTIESGTPIIEGGTNQNIDVTANFVHDDSGADVNGTDLWEVIVFGSVSLTGSGTRTAESQHSLTPTSTMFDDSTDLDFTSVSVNFQLNEAICTEVEYLCFEVLENTDMLNPPSIDFTLSGENVACALLDCNGVIVTDTTLAVTNGEPILEREGSASVDLSIAVVTDNAGAVINGSNLWALTVFTNDEADGKGSILFETQLPGSTNALWPSVDFYPAGNTFMLSDVSLNIDLTNIICSSVPYICVNLTKGESPSTDFTLDSNPQDTALSDCVEIDCQGVVVDSLSLTINETDEEVVEHSDSDEVKFNLQVTAEANTVEISGTNIWQLRVFLNDMSDGMGDSQGTEFYPNIGDSANEALGGSSVTTFSMEDITASFDLQDFVCPATTYFCVELQKAAAAPEFTLEFSDSSIVCQSITCRGVELMQVTVTIDSGDIVTEYISTHQVTLDLTLLSADSGATIVGTDLWRITTYLSADSNGDGDRFAEMIAETGSYQDINLPTAVTTLLVDVVTNLDVSDVSCSKFDYICVEVAQSPTSNPDFTLDPTPDDSVAIACTAIQCTGLQLDTLEIDILSGSPLIELTNPHSLTASITLLSNPDVDLDGTDWDVELTIGTDDDCTGSTIMATHVSMVDVMMGENIVLQNVQGDFDLSNSYCNELTYLCVRVEKASTATPDFATNSEYIKGSTLIPCEGVIIDNVTLSVTGNDDQPICEADMNFLVDLDVSLYLADNSRTFNDGEVENIWNLTLFTSPDSDGSTINGSPTVVSLMNDQLAYGIASIAGRQFTTTDTPLDTYGLTCDEMQYLCIVASKRNDITPDITITFPNEPTCIAVTCKGVVFEETSASFYDADDNEIREQSPTNVTFSFDINSNVESAVLSGTDLWAFSVFVSADSNGAEPRYGETMASLTDVQGSIGISTLGNILSFTNVAASLDLSDLLCFEDPNLAYRLCIMFMRNSDSDPAFSMTTTNGNPLGPYCSIVSCRGVEITGATVETTSGDPVLERNSNTIGFSITLESDPEGANAIGDNLWALTADLKDRDGNDFTPEENVVITVSEAGEDLTAGTDLELSGLTVSVDLTNFICEDQIQLCVNLQKDSGANPDFTLMLASGVFPSCVDIECEGVVITSSTLTETSSATFKEGSNNQDVEIDLRFLVADDAGGIDGSDQWNIKVFVNNASDGSGDVYSEVYSILPANLPNIPAIPGENLDFSSIMATLDFSSPEYLTCRDIKYLCATLEKADTATKNFSLSGRPTEAVTACQEIDCEGVIIETTELTITTSDPFVKEGSTETLEFNIVMTPDSGSSTLTNGASLWTVEAFGSSISDGSGDRFASVVVINPSEVGMVGVTPGSTTDLTGFEVMFDLTDISCSDFNHMCVEVSRNQAADPFFTLDGSPTDASLVGCVEIECIGVRVTGGTIDVESNTLPVLEGLETLNIGLNVQFNTHSSGADIMGADLWNLQVFTSSSATGMPATSPKVSGILDGTSNSQQAIAGNSLTFNSLMADLNTTATTCGNELYVCAELVRDTSSDPEFTLNGYDASVPEINDDMLTVCTTVDCQGVVISTSSLTVTDGGSIIENENLFSVTLDASFTSEADSGAVNGDGNWGLQVFINDASDGTGDSFSTLTTADLGSDADLDLEAGNSVTFSNVNVDLDLSNIVCEGLTTYLCVNLIKGSGRDFSLEGTPDDSVLTVCEEVRCVGVTIISSTISVTSPTVRENQDNLNVLVDFSMTASALSASVSGSGLWSVTVFTNSDNTGKDPSHAFSTEITLTSAQSQEGVVPDQTTTLSDLTFSMDLDRISCEIVPFICANISRNQGDFSFTAENNTDTACTPLSCNGVIIVELTYGAEGVSSDPVEHDSNYQFQITPYVLVSDDSALLGSGLRLWDYRFFANTEQDGSGDNNGIEHIIPDVTSNINSHGYNLFTPKTVTFDLSSIECDQIPYICLTLSKSSNPTRLFTLQPFPDASILTACVEVMCKGVEVTQAALTINTGADISEGDSAHTFDISAAFSIDPTGATIAGDGLWQLTLFATRESDGTGTRYIENLVTLGSQEDNDINNDQLALLNLQTTVSLENEYCSNLMYLCVELGKGNSPQPQDFTLDGELIGCQPLECLAITITDTSVTTSSSLIENSVGNTITLSVTLDSEDNSLESVTNLWLITVFTSDQDTTDPSSDRFNEANGAISSTLETQRLTAGTPLIFDPVAVSVDVETTCVQAAYICVEVRQATTAQPRVVLIGQTIGCSEITCRNVETTSTSATISSGGNLVEGENSEDVVLDIAVQSNSGGASIFGSDLWKMTMFFSSTDGEDGKIDSSETPLVLTSAQANADLTAGSALEITGLTASLPMDGITCDDALYICVDFRRGDSPSVDFTMSPMPDRATAQVGCTPVASCQGIEIEETTFDLQVGSPLVSAEANALTFSVNLDIASNSGTVSGDNLWKLTFFPNSESDGSGAYLLSSSLVVSFTGNSEVISGVTTGLDNIDGMLDLTGVLCEDAQYLCLVVSKGDNPETDFTIEDTSDLAACSAVSCVGVSVSTELRNVGDFTILEDASSLPFDFALDVTSNDDGASVAGDNLWNVVIFLSTNNAGTGTRVSETTATLDDASQDLASGAAITISGSAELDLDGVICSVTANHICASLSKSPSASPDFTIEEDEYVSCKEFACEGVVVTNTDVTVVNGDPLLQLTENFDVNLNIVVTTADLSAEISGTDLWEFEVFVSGNADGSGDKEGTTNADLTSSQSDMTLASGMTGSFLGVSATLDLSAFRCNNVDNYICAIIARSSSASPLFSLEGETDGALTGCVAVDCEGIRITSVGVTVTSGSPMKEDNNAQTVRFNVEIMSDPLYAGVNGDDLWAAEAFLSPVADGSQRTDFIMAVVPSSEMDKDLVPGVTLSLDGLSGVFDISGKRCSEVMYLCVEIEENANAAPDFDFASTQSLTGRTGCVEIRCLGIGIQQVSPNFENTGVAEGDDQHTFNFNVEVFPWAESLTISGSNIWDLNVFVSASNDDSTPRYGETLANLSPSQRSLALSPPTALDFQGVSATLDLSGYTCDQYMYACVEVVKTGAEAQGITLGGYPDENDVLGCQQITCAQFASEITITRYTDELIEFTWTEAIGYFNAYEVSYTPSDGIPNTATDISSTVERRMDLEQLTPGQLYTIELRLVKDGVVKSTGVVTVTQRTKPHGVTLLADSRATQEIELSWTAAAGVFDNYVIEYTPDTGVPASPASFSSSDTSALFTNLLPGRVYEFEIYTVSGNEQSSRSSVTEYTIPPDSEISAVDTTTTTVDLVWTTPDGIEQNYQYKLTYNPNSPANPILLNSGVNEYTVESLTPGQLYMFTLSVVAMDAGEVLESNERSTSQRTDPSPVTSSAETTEETQFTIQWEAAVGVVDQYILSYTLEGSSTVVEETTISTSSLMYQAAGLMVAQPYTVSIITESGGLQSEPYTKRVTTRPFAPSNVVSDEVTENLITISWTAAAEPVDYYVISYTPIDIGISGPSPQSTSSTQLTLTNILPHTTVEYTIRTETNGALSRPVIYRQRTFSAVPGPVMSFSVVKDKAYQVLVSFNAPSEPNGVITSYIIAYTGTRGNDVLDELFFEITAQPNHVEFQNIAISGLTAGYTYSFTITASNLEGQGEPVTQSDIALDLEPPLIIDELSNAVTLIDSTDTTFTITIRSNLFSDLNGVVVSFVIMVREYSEDEDLSEAAPAILPTYRGIQGNNFWGIYQSGPRRNWFTNAARRRRRQAESVETVTITVGDEDPCSSSTEPCNGPLKTATSWRYAIRGYNEEGQYSDTEWSSRIVTNRDPKIFGYIVAGTVGVFTILLIILLICVCCSCNDEDPYISNSNGKIPLENVSYGGHYNANANNSTVVEVHPRGKSHASRRGRFSRPVPNTRFVHHVKSMGSAGRYKFSDEYEDLRTIGLEQTSVAGDLLENRYKNRYSNILPYDHNRVQISGAEDYINASFMTGVSGAMEEYIATQGPLPDTKNDFWRMIWDHNVPTIVMIGKCVEQGRVKCDHYWPFDQDSTIYGNITVTMTAENAMPEWIIREFTIEKDGVVRAVRHFNYTEWPAHGVPTETDTFMRFVRTVHAQSSPNAGPTAVHCSAGVGRTAVFIALDILSQYLVRQKSNDNIDIFGVVAQMRLERCYMVQTEAQYVFIHQAVLDLLLGKVSGNNWFLQKKGQNLSNDLDAIQMEANIVA
ncbi:uncharacterized protein [Antedon mediterranea]|uniref:uncharacterized protein n=1 Tax=Antedon mediterranea TaxID=105859 RepID=UPI003AF709E1